MESRLSVEEKLACSCFDSNGRLEALQLGFTPTSRSGHIAGTRTVKRKDYKLCTIELRVMCEDVNHSRYS